MAGQFLNGTGNYTPAQASAFYADANIPYASDLAPLFQGNMTPSNTSPGTHFYGFYGTGIPTLVGQTYTNLTSAGNLILNSLNITLNVVPVSCGQEEKSLLVDCHGVSRANSSPGSRFGTFFTHE
ncbi:hypothetical protein WJX84_004574 [Apatococcus fuscideae]|uniref:Uncharacterized protein n=1 Tax=Apatococcus fuscideae TaxID=2026836 RepID=A0AAW1TEC8_9CHLO